ncbi:SMCs flexible hinge [Melanogaster broomeanus]|nr:SMCs flexible hinge [Melanogaster broomeanus]
MHRGQATFLPLDTISAKSVNDKFRSCAKGARLAVDVIQYEPAVERTMNHGYGNALVCDTMEAAKYICWEKDQKVKVGGDSFGAVMVEGTIIHKSGLMTCGRSTHGSGKKWEEKDVQGLMQVGIYRDQDVNSSRTLTLDLTPMALPEVKSMDFDGGEEIAKAVEEEPGRGKRKRKANTLYTCSFWLDHSGD